MPGAWPDISQKLPLSTQPQLDPQDPTSNNDDDHWTSPFRPRSRIVRGEADHSGASPQIHAVPILSTQPQLDPRDSTSNNEDNHWVSPFRRRWGIGRGKADQSGSSPQTIPVPILKTQNDTDARNENTTPEEVDQSSLGPKIDPVPILNTQKDTDAGKDNDADPSRLSQPSHQLDDGRNQSRSLRFPSHIRSITPQRPRCKKPDVLGPKPFMTLSCAQPIRANQSRPRKPVVTLKTLQTLQQADEEEKRVQAMIKDSNSQKVAIANLKNERDNLKNQTRDSKTCLGLYEQELKKQWTKVQEKDDVIAGLEKRVEDYADLEERLRAKVKFAKFRADLYEGLDKKGNDMTICEYREISKAQWLRAENAEKHVRQMDRDLAHAHSQLQDTHNSSEEILMLQQKLDTSLENSHKANREIQRLQEALTKSDNNAKEIFRQCVEHIQGLNEGPNQELQRLNQLRTQEQVRADQEVQRINQLRTQEIARADQEVQRINQLRMQEIARADQEVQRINQLRTQEQARANQEVQRLNELMTQEKARADQAEHANRNLQQTNAEQAILRERVQNETARLKRLADERGERASNAARQIGEKTQELAELTDRANHAEAKVEDLEHKISNLETAVAQKEEAAREPSPNPEAASAVKELNDRLERELEDARELLEELSADEMDSSCRDQLEKLVFTNNCFGVVEEEIEDHHAPSVEALNNILEESMANLDNLHLIENGDRPSLVRQLKEAHYTRMRIDEIIEDAQLLGQVYLDEEDIARITKILGKPRTLPDPAPSAASQPNNSTPSPLYNPVRPQQPPLTMPPCNPEFPLPTSTAGPTSGAPPPFNPLWSLTQPANPSTSAPSSTPYRPSTFASTGSTLASLIPLLNLNEEASESDSDNELPEAFAGQYDEESDSDDAIVPPVGQRPIRKAVSRRRPNYPKAADFM